MDAFKRAILRAIIYARVSTDDQADKGYSLPTQLEACRKYAERQGFTIVGNRYYDVNTALEVVQKAGIWQFVDSAKAARLAEQRPMKPIEPVPAFVEDYSGATPIAERPEGKKVVEMLKRREADAVIIYQVDRLSRDIVDLLASVRLWLRAGVEVHTCDIGKIESELDIVLVIKGWQGSDERKKIIERTTRGRRGKAASGKVVGNGWSLYGYRYVTEADPLSRRQKVVGLEIYEPEARIVRMVYRWYVRGDEIENVPMSLHGITRRLTTMRIPCPGERVGLNRKVKSGVWNLTQVSNILSHEGYVGTWRYGMGTANAEPITVNIPSIIDYETWNAAQARREYNKRMSKRNAKREYLLKGFIKCGCNRSMAAGHVGRSSHLYYQCGRRWSPADCLNGTVCKEPMVRQDEIESFVGNRVVRAIIEDPALEAALYLAQERELAGFESVGDQLATLLEMIEETERESDNLAAIAANTPGGVFKRSLKKQIDEVEARYNEYIAKRDTLQGKLNGRTLTDERIVAILALREDIKLGLENPTIDDLRQVFQTIQLEIVIKNHKMHISCILPTVSGIIEISHSRIPLRNNTLGL